MSFIADLKRRNVFRVGAAYVVVGWLTIQVVETIFPAFGFGDSAIRWVVIALGIGLLPALVFAWVFELTPEGLKKEKDVDRSQSITHITGRRLDFGIIGVLVVALAYFAIDKFVIDPRRDAAAASVAREGLQKAQDMIDQANFAKAWAHAHELMPALRDEALRAELWDLVSYTGTLESEPPGADVWIRPYHSTEADWQHLGRTPVVDTRIPLGMTRFRLELEGHQPMEVALEWDDVESPFRLDPEGVLPEGMVRVPGAEFQVFLPGLEHLEIELPDFFIDAREVTNREFQAFVDAGGYKDPQFWNHPIMRDGMILEFEDAKALFTDQTGRPGPATWAIGRYPEGLAEHPVGGVSWYEAAAYAHSVGKQLPTLYHWYLAAAPGTSEYLLPHSNFSGASAVVGSHAGMSWSGAHDMAGNAREWIWNASDEDRFILGGGWNDLEYMFTDANAQSPMDRTAINGLRLMVTPHEANLDLARAPIMRPDRDYFVEQPVADDIFEVYRRLYHYDPTPLNAVVVESATVENWVREEIELDAAYDNERFTVFLYLPRNAEQPYRPVVFFPGSRALYRSENPSPDYLWADFLITSGHAVLFPIYKGTFERGTEINSDIQDETNYYRQHVIAWYRDMARALDYLETRPEVDTARLTYFGVSWGGAMAPVMLSLEPRIQTAVLLSGGLVLQPTQPEVDPFNFLPRVTVPTLMINVPNDFFYPLEGSQKPFFQFLGSEQKQHLLFSGSHIPPRNDITRETLKWLDQYPEPNP